MPFPESQREIYSRNPLKEVICQLRFPTILQVTAESPAKFQDRIRQNYPYYTEEKPEPNLPKGIGDILAGLSLPKGLQTPLHKFLTDERTRAITLNQEFLAVSEAKYRRWQDFKAEINAAEIAFRELYKPSFYTRIGLRYKNFIDRKELGFADKSWGVLLNKSLIGPLGVNELSPEIRETRAQCLMSLAEVPNSFVRIIHGVAQEDSSTYLVDADFFIEEKENLDESLRILDEFNKLAARFFHWATTDTLRQALGPIQESVA